MKHGKVTRKKQKGQAMVEYTICALILILALFAPVPPESKSVVNMLIEAIKKNHEAKAHAIGNPVVGSSTGF
ncbi:MAG: hypothetical protein LBF93_04860 [Zoogloeaceae bacterium]|jgi:MFS superfamily sulfate permease-like transporter|nr:hypothetical protein [Zoogloeaceae bacterium]